MMTKNDQKYFFDLYMIYISRLLLAQRLLGIHT